MSFEDWNKQLTLALKTDPKLAGEMMGYLQGQGKFLPNAATSTVVLTGPIAAKLANLVKGGKASPQPNYKSDVGNLGVNSPQYNKELNESINNRNPEHYINEQASRRVNTVTVPIDFEGHIINGEIKGRKVVGGHSALGNVRVDEVLNTYSNGVYEAKISVFDPNTGKYIAKTNNKGVSTMFPQNWTADRIKVEVQHAYTNKRPHSDPVKAERGMWEGTTYSGVKVEGYRESTVYPVKEQ